MHLEQHDRVTDLDLVIVSQLSCLALTPNTFKPKITQRKPRYE